MVTKVPMRTAVRTISSLARFGQGRSDGIGECIAALGGSGHVVDFGALPFHYLSRQVRQNGIRNPGRDPTAGIARQALRYRRRDDLAVLNLNRGLDIAVAATAPAKK